MRTGDGFICVYSIILQQSFEEAISLHDHILCVKDQDKVPFVLVGNKCDLEEDREVPFEKGQNFASSLGCPFLEASAKTRKNVAEVFEAIVREINKERKNPNEGKTEDGNNTGTGQTKKKKKHICMILQTSLRIDWAGSYKGGHF